MKNLAIIISIIFSLSLFAQENNKINISYKISINENFWENINENIKISNISDQLSYKQKELLFSAFLNKIKKEKSVASYKLPENGNNYYLNSENKLYRLNGDYILGTEEGRVTAKNGVIYLNNRKVISFNSDNLINQLMTLEFFETWNFNPQTGSFIKTVHQMGLQIDSANISFKTKPYKKNVYETATANTYNLTNNNLLIGKVSYFVLIDNHRLESRINPENNNYYNYIQPQKRQKFVSNIFEYLKNEMQDNKDHIVYSDEIMLDYDSVINTFIKVDTLEMENLDGSISTVVAMSYDELDKVSAIYFTETWYIDVNTFAIKKVVNSFAPVIKTEKDFYYDMGIDFVFVKPFNIQAKNSINKKNSPFYNKQLNSILSENLYTLGGFIYKTDGVKLLPDTFDYMGSDFYNDLLETGKETSIDSVELETLDGMFIMVGVGVLSYGLINKNGEKIIPCIYDEINLIHDSIALVTYNNDYDEYYSEEEYYNQNIIKVMPISQLKKLSKAKGKPLYNKDLKILSDKYYTLNNQIYKNDGSLLLPYVFADISDSFKYNLLVVGKYTGKVDSINTSYEDFETGEFIDTVIIKKEWLYGVINNKGKNVTPAKYESITILNNKYIKIAKNGAYGIVDINGRELIPTKYDDISLFGNNKFIVNNDDKYGILNANGEKLTEIIYDKIITYDSVCKLKEDNKYGLYNIAGEEKLKCENLYISEFKHGKAFVYDGKKYFSVNKKGDFIKNEQLPIVEQYNNGYKKTRLVYRITEYDSYNDKEIVSYGLQDNKGNDILLCEYSDIDVFTDNLFKVNKDTIYYIIDETGKKISKSYNYISNIKNAVSKVFNGKGISIELDQDYYGVDGNYYNEDDKNIVTINNKKYYKPSINEYLDNYREYEDYFNNKKFGLINTSGKEVIPAKYDKLDKIKDNVYLTKQDTSYYLIDISKKTMMELGYDEVLVVKNNEILKYQKDNKWGLLDEEANKITENKYNEIYNFRNGCAIVKIENKQGYINKQGDVLIPVIYDNIFIRNDSIVIVTVDNKQGVINTKGEIIIPADYDDISTFNNNYKVTKDNKQGIVNMQGDFLLPLKYNYISSFNDGYAKVFIGEVGLGNYPVKGKYGLVNEDYELDLPVKYEEIQDFNYDGLARIKKKGKWGIINEDFEFVIKCKYKYLSNFTDTLATVYNGKDKFYTIDKNEKFVEDIYLGYAETFDNNTKKIFISGLDEYGEISEYNDNVLYGLTDSLNNIILPCKYAYLDYYNENILKLGSVYKIIKDKKITKDEYNYISEFIEDIAIVYKGLSKDEEKDYSNKGKYGLINKYGDLIINCEYDLIYYDYYLNGYIVFKGTQQKSTIAGNNYYVEWYPKEGEWQLLNIEGKPITNQVYQEIGSFFDDIAFVKINNKYGYINTKGEIIIPCEFDKATGVDYIDGKYLMKVEKDGEIYYLNTEGERVE